MKIDTREELKRVPFAKLVLVGTVIGVGASFLWFFNHLFGTGPPVALIPMIPHQLPASTPPPMGGPVGIPGPSTSPVANFSTQELQQATQLANSSTDPQTAINACYNYLSGLRPNATDADRRGYYNYCSGQNQFLQRVTGGVPVAPQVGPPGGGVAGRGGRG